VINGGKKNTKWKDNLFYPCVTLSVYKIF